jgi:serine/threonine protein kinase
LWVSLREVQTQQKRQVATPLAVCHREVVYRKYSPFTGSARILTSPLAFSPGTRLGVYDITASISEGGMGHVYRATDTTLGRQVAIKILPDAFAADLERLARFEREAKTLASLNHLAAI